VNIITPPAEAGGVILFMDKIIGLPEKLSFDKDF
jgi:hypothetical protein